MGRGNYLPVDHDWFEFEMVYVDNSGPGWLGFEQLVADIQDSLPQSFSLIRDHDHSWGADELIVAENNLLDVRLHEEDNYVAVIVRPRRSDPFPFPEYGLALHHLPKVANRVWRGMVERHYKLRVRTSAWTTTPRPLMERETHGELRHQTPA